MRGCVSVSTVCEVGEAPLVFFAEDAASARADFDGEALPVRTTTTAGGLRVQVRVPIRRGTLTVSLPGAEAPRSMRVEVDAVGATDSASTATPGEEQREASIPAESPASDRAVAVARFAEARRLYKDGDAEGAVAALADSAASADRAELHSQAARSRLLTAWIATKSLRDFEAARAALAAVPVRSRYDQEADILRAFHAAVLASEVGDRREALAQIEPAKIRASQLGADDLATKLEIRALNTLHELGRFDEAATRWRALVEIGTGDGCLDQLAASNLGWSLMHASKRSDEAGEWFDRALEAFRSDCPEPPPTRRANVLVNAALFYLQRGELDRAQAALDASAGLPMLPEHAQWFAIVEGGVALERGEPKRAEAISTKLAERATAERLTEVAWHAWVGVGKSREATGRLEAASRAYAEAEACTVREAVLVPVDGGRQHLYGDRDESARRWIALELARGRPAAAFEVLRRARRRALIAIELARRTPTLDGAARARWERDVARYRKTRDALEQKSAALSLLPKSQRAKHALEVERTVVAARRALDKAIGELARGDLVSTLASSGDVASTFRAPMPGEVLVAWFPLVKGWALFAQDADRIVAAVVDEEPSPDLVVSRLHDPIAAAERVTVLAPGGSDRFALHRADFEGSPLGRRKLVVYALDLPPRSIARTPTKSALVVSDSRGDLRGARDEGAEVEKNLGDRGWRVTHVRADGATRRRFLAGLARVDLLHFAGHGTYGGHEGWESSLLLADGRVTVGDVLTSTEAPDAVLLLGCRTAESSGVGASAGVGLAQAFVLAGARAVVAATREVDDAATAAVSARLSSALDDGSDLLATYQRTVHGADDELPEGDAFVVVTP